MNRSGGMNRSREPHSLFRSIVVEGVFAPVLLLAVLLLLMAVFIAHPLVFHPLYRATMETSPELLEDGLRIADGLWEEQPYAEIGTELRRGVLGQREIHHFEDIRHKLRVGGAFAAAGLGGLVMMVVVSGARPRRIAILALAWMVGLLLGSGIWAAVSFRHFFRTLHWWVFQDDSWILPTGCYTLQLYPYPVWQSAGVVLATGALATLGLLVLLLGLRRRDQGG